MMHRKISFEIDGVILRGDLFSPEKTVKRQAALFLHGWTGKTNFHAAQALTEHGYYAMTFSLPGHNDSEGDFENLSRKQSLKASLAAYDYLASNLPENTNIALIGNSFGGYLAPLVAHERKVNGLSLRVPADYPDEHFDKPQAGQGHENPEVFEWRHKRHNYDETKALRAVNDFRGFLQIIEAGLDDFVPPQTVQSYADAFQYVDKLEYHTMKDWPHSLADDKVRNKQFQELILHWLNKL